ncbi:glycine--tRNA ligase subunit beta [Kordiimonas gwangyangensis]|uniref:glycine--tRNA ligase subunit beta n=1 Tax=Kordiimonas gwangyangensis TaxID=288022 RepID=UPI00036AB4AA|nr:glycine--tRNA ligase subunit beta [Kordiimonas gwangyangensis]
MADLLIELFSEEIPAGMQKKASEDLEVMVLKGLEDAGLKAEASEAYATPRRLVLAVSGLPLGTPDVREERRGPRIDAPEKAIEGFLRGAKVARHECEEREDPKGTFLYAIIEKKGQETASVVAQVLEQTVRNFPWPKSQRWGEGSLKWVRPLQSILCVFNDRLVPFQIETGETKTISKEDVKEAPNEWKPYPSAVRMEATNVTYGHRFMAPDSFAVDNFADYKAKLLDHKVMLDPVERMTLIADRAKALAAEKGVEWVEDKGLLAEVAGLVEWPVPIMGSFDPAFMSVPEEVLILTMKKDQKYFVTRDKSTGKLAPFFITVSNIEPTDGGKMVAAGNERVLTARLSDAKFFWEQDLKHKLEDNLPQLADIVFHIELGRVSDRVERMKALARYLAQFIPGCDVDEAERAAELAKADLVSGMVFEFPEVQGVMGRYYAKAQGESDAVADAIRDHYAPAGPNDDCPTAPVSVAVALAEKLDTLMGFFAIDKRPTGSKDPYALRRAALGIIRLITENGVRLELAETLVNAAKPLKPYLGLMVAGASEDAREEAILRHVTATIEDHLLPFFADRLKVQQRDQGVRHDLIDAVFAKGDDDLVRVLSRVSALSAFLDTEDGANLLAGYKRAANILRIEEKKDGRSFDQAVDAGVLTDTEEKALASALKTAAADAEDALMVEDFEKAMAALSSLRAPIDAFFERVTVNADDEALRANRLALLSQIRAAVNTVADFSLIEG